VKQGRHITAIAVVLCVVLANTGVLHAVHLLSWNGHRGASDNGRPCWKPPTAGGHDSYTCSLCTHLASVKKVFTDTEEPTALIADVIENVFHFTSPPIRSVCLSSLSPRAPPFVCL
jgi:hypothetical protein